MPPASRSMLRRQRRRASHRRRLLWGVGGVVVVTSVVAVSVAAFGLRGTSRSPLGHREHRAVPTTEPRPTTPVARSAIPAGTVPPPIVSETSTSARSQGPQAQTIVVSAPSYGATVATLTAYQETGGLWATAFGPWSAHLGYNGLAPPGTKREGDGRTPSGSYGFSFFFGLQPDPGVAFPFRRVTGPSIVWDDDPASPAYNTWVDTTQGAAGADPEPMDNPPAYDYGAVVAYNMNPVVPGAGSAIFLHVSTGGPTAGCVSLPEDELLALLRWMDPAVNPTVTLGVDAPAP